MEHRLHSNNISVGVSSPWGPHSNNEIILPKTGAETESTIGMCVLCTQKHSSEVTHPSGETLAGVTC